MPNLNFFPNGTMKAAMPLLFLVTSLLSPLLSPRLQAEPIVIDNLVGFNSGIGFAGSWANNTMALAGGLTFADLYSQGGSAVVNQQFGTSSRVLSNAATGDIYGSFLFSMDGFGNAGTTRQLAFTSAANQLSNWNLPLNTSLGPNSIVNNTGTPGTTTFSTFTTYLVLFEGHLNGSSLQDYTVWVLSAAQYNNLGPSGLTASSLNSASIGTAASEIMNRVQFLNRPAGFDRIVSTNLGGNLSHITFDRITISYSGLNDIGQVPEPSTWALCAGALAWGVHRLRRR